jgi:protein TonB
MWSDPRIGARTTAALVSLGLATACATARRPVPVDVPLASPPRPVEELTAQLGAAEASTRAAAAWALAGARDVDERTIAALKAALDDPSPGVREGASWTLGQMKTRGLDTGELMDVPPRVLVQTKPFYPSKAFDERLEGVVGLEILIDEQGIVSHVEVRRSLPAFDAEAVKCVRQWRFEPARRNGRPVACLAQVPMSFRIY